MMVEAFTKRISGLLVLLAALMLRPACCYAATDIYVTVDHGYGSSAGAKQGRYLPVTLHMDNRTASPAQGQIQVKAAGSDGDIYEYEYLWELEESEKDDMTYYIPLGYHSEDIAVRVLQQGEEIYSRRIDLDMDADTKSLMIAALCDEPESLAWLDGKSVNYGLLKTHIYDFDAATFPQDRRGLDMFDLIIVTNYRLRNLSETQMRAMLDWVRDGGVLLLGTGARADDTLGRLAPELLDDRYSEPELRELDITLGTAAETPSDGVIEAMQITAALHGGNSLWRADEYTVVSAVTKDSGMIAVASFDVSELESYAGDHAEYADRFLNLILTSSRITELSGEFGSDDTYEYLNLLLGAGDVEKLPPVQLQAVALLAYILLAGPGLYIFLKQHGAAEYYRRGVVVLAMVFAALIYFIGIRTRFEENLSGYVAVVTGDDTSATETIFLNLRAPYSSPMEARSDKKYTVLPISSSDRSGISGADNTNDESDVRIAYSAEDVRITIASADEFAPKFFRLERSLEEDEALKTVTGNLELFEGKLTGTIINGSGQQLSGVSVIGYGKLYYIGDMAAGETRVLTDVAMTNVPLRDSYDVAKTIFGEDEYEKTGIFTFLRECYFDRYSADLRVVAFAGEDTLGEISCDAGCTGSRVLVSLIPTECYRDGMICRPAVIEEPLTVSGYYAASSNTMLTDEELVLEYRLGEDINPKALYIEYVDDAYPGFEGTIFWYNVYAAAYEPVTIQDGLVDADSLETHISENHTVTLRYVYTGDRKNTFEVSLPMINVIGDEE